MSKSMSDLEIAERAVELGLLSPEQLAACIAERRQQQREGLLISLRELIVDGGHIDGSRWQALAGSSTAPEAPLAETRSESPAAEPRQAKDGVEVLGGYRILSELGRGAMGVVYEAQQEGLGRRVALKVLPEAAALRGIARERFVREAKATASLKHPGIVPIYDIGEARGVQFFAMELLEGRSLRQRLDADGRFSPERAAALVEQVAEALAFAHGEGVIHRDVKPDNIIVTDEGRAVVTDFGLARDLSDRSLTREGVIVGTPLYMAPEQARGDGAPVDARADVYGLGITLYELLAGSVPFDSARDTGELIERVVHHEPPPLPTEIPLPLRSIVEVAVEKDPARRYQSAGDLAADLARFRRGEPIVARPPSKLTRVLRRARRGRRTLTAICVLLASLALTGAALRQLSRQWRADALVLESLSLSKAGNLAQAHTRLDQALQLRPGMPEALFRLGELDRMRGASDEQVLASFDDALARDPGHTDALLARGELLRHLGRSAEALADFEAAKGSAGDLDPRPALGGGLALAALDRDGDARSWLGEGLDLARTARAPRDGLYLEAVTTYGVLTLGAGDPTAALPELEEAVRLAPAAAGPRLGLTQALLDSGNTEAAVDAASAALVRDPKSLEARELRARAARLLGHYPQVAADLDASVDRPTARLLRGVVRFEVLDSSGKALRYAFDQAGAAEDLEAALSSEALSSAEQALAHLALGWLQLLSERPRKSPALRAFDRAVELAPDSALARLSRGLLRLRWGRLDEAGEDLARAKDLTGGGYGARVALAQLARARQDPETARRLLDEAIAAEPSRPTAYGERFRLRLGLGDPRWTEDWPRGLTRQARVQLDRLPVGLDSDPFSLAERASEAGFAEFALALRTPVDQRRLERAGAWIRHAIAFDPTGLSATARHASIAYLLGHVAQAEEAYARARAVDPSLIEADLMRGVVQRDLREGEDSLELAEETFRRALAEAPPKADLQGRLRFELAKTLLLQGHDEDALALLDEALGFTPRRYCVAALRARLMSRLGRSGSEEAIRHASALFQSGERDTIRGALYRYAGERQRRFDQYERATHYLNRAIEADHRSAEAWRERARSFLHGEGEQMALGLVDTYVAAELDPAYTERFMELEGRVGRFRHLLPHMSERVDEMMRQAPELPAATFMRGYLALHEGDLPRAEELFQRAYELSSETSYFAVTYRGAARMRSGELEAAEADLARADAIFPNGPVTAFWKACLYARQGKDEEVFLLLEDQRRRGHWFPGHLRDAPELQRILTDPRMIELFEEGKK